MNIQKPSPEQLAHLLSVATKKQTVEQYRETFVAAIKKLVGRTRCAIGHMARTGGLRKKDF